MDSFETKLQIDPMLQAGANRVGVWTIAGAIVILVIITFVGSSAATSDDIISKGRFDSQLPRRYVRLMQIGTGSPVLFTPVSSAPDV